jgi:hypothetical protein
MRMGTYQELFTIADVTPIAIVGALVNDITCNAANGTTNNGSASFTVTELQQLLLTVIQLTAVLQYRSNKSYY